MNGSKDNIRAFPMGPMRIGKISSHINLMGHDLRYQLLDNLHILLRDRQLLYLSALIEGKVQKMNMVFGNMVIGAGITSLPPANQSFDRKDTLIVEVSFLLLPQVVHNLLIADLDDLIRTVGKELVEPVDKVHVETYFLISNGNVATRLVSDMHIMSLLHQPADGTSHRDDIIIGMR